MPLYRVRIETEIVVCADDEDAAIDWTNDNREWLDDLSDSDVVAIEVKTVKDLPDEKWVKSIPWGDQESDRSCAEWLEATQC